MYPAQKGVGGTAMSLYPAFFWVLSISEGQCAGKIEKIRANHFLWLVQTIIHRVTVPLFVLALLVKCVLDFTILDPFLSPELRTLLRYWFWLPYGSELYPAC